MGFLIGFGTGLDGTGAARGDTQSSSGGAEGSVTLNAFSRDFPVFDAGAALGLAGAEVPVSGTTDAANGTVIEARAVEAGSGQPVLGWQAVGTAQGGQWAGELADVPLRPAWLQVEARVQGGAAIARASQRFAAGHVIDLWGQSELHRAVLSSFAFNGTLPPVTDDETLQVTFSDATGGGYGGAVEHRFITQSDPWTGHLVELSNMLAAERPGEKFHITLHTLSGTGVRALLDNTNDDRDWADELALGAVAHADGQVAGLAIQSWYNADAGTLGNSYGDYWLRAITGQDLDGSPWTGFDHSFAELYDYGRTKWVIAGPHRFEAGSFDNPIPAVRTGLNQAFTNPVLTAVAIRGIEPLAYRNGTPSGTDVAHPTQNDRDGFARLMMFMGQGMLHGLGLAAFSEIPRLDQAALSADRTHLRVWSSAGPLITTRSARGEMATLPAGRPELSGFEIDGAEALRVALTGGEAHVYYNQAGDPFPDGSVVTHGNHGIGTTTLPDDLTINEVWKDYPLVDLGQLGVEGIPVRGMTPSSVLDVIPGVSAPAGYDPAESLVPAENPFRTGSASISGVGGWNNVSNGTAGTFNGDGTISLAADNGLVRGNVEVSQLAQPVVGQTVDAVFYLTSPDAASGSLDVTIRQGGGGGNVVLLTQTITPMLGELITFQVTPTANRRRLEILFQRGSGGQSGTYVIHAPVLR